MRSFRTSAFANGADKEVSIGLLGDAVFLLKEAVAEHIHAVGFPPLKELIGQLKGKVTVYV